MTRCTSLMRCSNCCSLQYISRCTLIRRCCILRAVVYNQYWIICISFHCETVQVLKLDLLSWFNAATKIYCVYRQWYRGGWQGEKTQAAWQKSWWRLRICWCNAIDYKFIMKLHRNISAACIPVCFLCYLQSTYLVTIATIWTTRKLCIWWITLGDEFNDSY